MDHKARLQSHQKWIQEELERSIRFWMKNGMDGARRRLYLSGSGGKGVLHGQECVDAGPLRLDLRLSAATCTE